MKTYPAANLSDLVAAIMEAGGSRADEARTIARRLVDSNLVGHDSHGVLLTIGAHKGSGLSILTDLLAGALTTGRSSDPDDTVLRNNMLSIYIAPALYDPEGGVLREARRLIDWVTASPPATPGQPVLAPGEVERRTRASRLADGVTIDDTTWADLVAAAQSVGIDAGRVSALIGG